MRKILAVIAFVCALAVAVPTLPGCGDDVKKVKKIERHRESPPQPVSPGEPIVE